MAITSDFSIFANTDFSTTPFQYLIFAGKAPLLHVELNELQYLGFMRDRVIMKALGNKCIGSITRDSNTKKTAIKGDFIIDGYAIANLDTTINTEIGDSIYFKVTLEEVTKDSELTKNGVVNGEAIENTIMDKARGFETSRRSAISVEITTVESQEAIKVASISDAGEVVFSIDTANTQEAFDAIKASIENLISSVEAERNRAMGVESGLNSGLAQMGQGLGQLSAQEGQHYTEVKNDLSNLKDGTTPVAKATEANTATTASNAEKVNGHTVGADVPSNAVFTDTVYDDSTVKASIQNIVNGTTQVGSATKATQDAQGNVINETYAKKTEVPQGTVVDDALSSTSTNPVQNKVVKAEFDKVDSNLDALEYGEVAGGKNLFDKNSSENVDGWLDNGIPNGENIYNQKTSHFIRIDGNTFVYNKGNVNNQIAFYDSNRAFINQFRQNDGINVVEIPANAKYVRVVYFDGEKDLVQIEKGTTATEYEPYIPSVKTLTEDVAELKNDLSNLKDGTTPVAKAVADEDGNNIKSTYAKISHKHTKSEITDFPTSMPASDVSAWAKASSKPSYTKSEVGLDKVDNTADKDKSVKYATSAGKALSDEDGNNIKSTYAKKTELDTKVNIADPVFTGSFSQNRKSGSTIGMQSHAEGSDTVASGKRSHAEGNATVASGTDSHAEGYATTANAIYSHAEGALTQANENSSHAEGNSTTSSGTGSHAEGAYTTARSYASHAEGYKTLAGNAYAHAEGSYTTASNFASHAAGKYNASMATGGSDNNTTGTAFVIGNGTSATALSNAFSVQYDGTVKAKSTITASTTADYAEFFEWQDGNINNEDRVGYFVTLDGNRIKIASDNDDYILGIVSGEPFVLGNGDCDTWNGMYLHDEFRRTIYEPAPKVEEVEIKEEREETYTDEETGEEKTRTVEVVVGHEFKEVEGEFDGTRPKLNPEYDNTQQYISRFDRKEWSPVGMLGVLAVRHDGTAKVNGYVTVNKNGIATSCDRKADNSYRVIKANTDSVVEVIFR